MGVYVCVSVNDDEEVGVNVADCVIDNVGLAEAEGVKVSDFVFVSDSVLMSVLEYDVE